MRQGWDRTEAGWDKDKGKVEHVGEGNKGRRKDEVGKEKRGRRGVREGGQGKGGGLEMVLVRCREAGFAKRKFPFKVSLKLTYNSFVLCFWLCQGRLTHNTVFLLLP